MITKHILTAVMHMNTATQQIASLYSLSHGILASAYQFVGTDQFFPLCTSFHILKKKIKAGTKKQGQAGYCKHRYFFKKFLYSGLIFKFTVYNSVWCPVIMHRILKEQLKQADYHQRSKQSLTILLMAPQMA